MTDYKMILALQNTIIHSRRPVFIIEEKGYKVVCDTPGSRDRLNIYVGRNLESILNEDIRKNELKTYVYKNNETNEVYHLKIESIIEGYKLVVPILVMESEKLDQIADSEAFKHNKDAAVLMDIERKVIAINDKFECLFGYKNKKIKGKPINKIFKFTKEENAYAIHILEETKYSDEVVMVAKRLNEQNESIKVQITHTPIYSLDELIGYQISYKELESNIITDLTAYQKIIDHHTDGIMIADENEKIIYANNAFINMLEYQLTELRQTKFFDNKIMNYAEPKLYKEMLHSVKTKFQWQGESWERKRSGKIIPVWKQIFIVKDEEGKVSRYVAIYKDLSDITSANMVKLVDRDPLTSLYTREYFVKRVTERLSKFPDNQRVLFIDIDNFKNLNDRNGHLFGDKILIEFSKIMVLVFRGHLKARYAGDEFVVYFGENIKGSDIVRLMYDFKEMVSKPVIIEGKEYFISVSMGLSISQQDGKTAAELLDVADHRMYMEKRITKEKRGME